MVAVIMALFFKERLSGVTVFSILLALSGIALLYRGDSSVGLNTTGVLLVLVSALTYALYMVVVNRSSIVMSSIKLTFYVLLVCMAAIALQASLGSHTPLQPLTTPRMWFFSIMLALVPTVISLFTLRLGVGIFMILVAVLLIIASKAIPVHKVATVIGHALRSVPLHRH